MSRWVVAIQTRHAHGCSPPDLGPGRDGPPRGVRRGGRGPPDLAPGAAARQEVPLKGASSGVLQLVSIDAQLGLGSFHIDGIGHSTQLGRFAVTGDITVDLATGIAQGNWTLTAADGDMLLLSMTGYGIDPTHGFGAFTIVGGSGRFEDASGYYEEIITFAAPIGTANVVSYGDVFSGTVSPGQN